ncbi:hypothetical protein BKI52_31375 [marine bacterium AO1-C]|nr:hypothetical protein BKI52_31375 [marine bacterium AO1-C]
MFPYQWLLLVGLLLGANANLWAQVTPDVPKSPNAESMEKFAEIPVGLYTGIPNISVPLCGLKSKQLSTAVSLSYHYTGFKPNEVPSWVGLGWTLNAGGVITRTVQGRPDDLPGGYHNYADQIKTSYDPYNNSSDWSFLKDIHLGDKDGQPDLYNFNVGGVAGQFFLVKVNNKLEARLIPHQNIKIEVPEDIKNGGWKITTPDGTIYEFGGTVTDAQGNTVSLQEASVTSSTPEASSPGTINFNQLNISANISAWYLKSITSANGTDSIKFYYNAKGTDITQVSWSENRQFRLEVYGEQTSFECPNPQTANVNKITTIISNRLHVKEIVGANGYKIVLTEGADRDDFPDKRLGSVALYNADNQMIKKTDLSYDYLTAGTYKRLLLKDVQQVSAYNTTDKKGAYRFTYQLPSGVSIDPVFEKGIDHWGYYNGAANTTLLPSFFNSAWGYNFVGANREVNPEKAKIGILTEMTNPMGGKASFTWESHVYNSLTCANEGSTEEEQVKEEVLLRYNYNPAAPPQTDFLTKEQSFKLDCEQNIEITTSYKRPLTAEGNATTAIANGKIFIYSYANGSEAALVEVFQDQGHLTKVFSPKLKAGNYVIKMELLVDNQIQEEVFANVVVNYKRTKFLGPEGCNQPGPGFRIAKVVMSDGLNSKNDIVKEYQYRDFANAKKSSGRMVSDPPKYGSFQMNFYPHPDDQFQCMRCLSWLISSESQVPAGYSKGSPVVYGQVKVLNGECGVNGSEEYEYSFTTDQLYQYSRQKLYDLETIIPELAQERIFAQKEGLDWKRGHLLTQRTYDASGRILAKTTNHYLSSDEGGDQSNHYEANVVVARIITDYICNDANTSETDLSYVAFQLTSAWHRLDRTESIAYTYDANDAGTTSQRTMTTLKEYFYDNPTMHTFVTRTRETDSEGRVLVTKNRYPQDILATEKFFPQAFWLKSKYMIGSPMISLTLQDNKVIGATYQEFLAFGPHHEQVFPKASYVADLATPLNTESELYAEDPSGKLIHFQRKQSYTFDINNGHIRQVVKEDDIPTAFIWNYNQTSMTAQVINATADQIAYTSFENATDWGGWNLSPTVWALDANNRYNGEKSLWATSQAATITSKGLPHNSGETYQVSFWKKGVGNVTIAGVTNLTLVKTLNTQWTNNGWSLYTAQVKGSDLPNGQVSITVDQGVYLDELRLHPVQARMQTFTHRPMVGVSSMTNERHQTQYYQYDNLNRLELARDFEGNILKRYTYKYKGE